MDIQFRQNESDFVAAQTAWLIRHPLAIGRWVVPIAMLLVLLLIVPIRVALHRERWQDMLAALAWTGWPILSYFMLRRRWRKTFAKSSLENVDVLATVDDRGIALSSQGQQKCHYWSGFTRIYESRRVVVLEESYGVFVYLPKSAMNPAQFEELKRFASSNPSCKVSLASSLT